MRQSVWTAVLGFGGCLLLAAGSTGCDQGERGALADARAPDAGGARRDARSVDATATARCDPASIGRVCSDDAECGAEGLCLQLDDATGVCSCSCRPDDPQTLAIEDDCPRPDRNVCANLEVEAAAGASSVLNLCMRQCAPHLGGNDCTAPLSCQPASVVQTPRDVAICLALGCGSDRDCLVTTAEPCQVAASTCGAGAECLPDRLGSASGICARSGLCDRASGLCAPRQAAGSFAPGARVGDPCDSDLACGAAMFCALEVDVAAELKAGGASCARGSECCSGRCLPTGRCAAGHCGTFGRNGYCTIEGCSFASLSDYACPPGSTCNGLYPAGWCQRMCDPREADGCRSEPADRYGDYECRAWNRVALTTDRPVTSAPVCDFGWRLSCAAVAELGFGCEQLGLPGNPTAMTCRSADGEAMADAAAATGDCFDSTASGPPP